MQGQRRRHQQRPQQARLATLTPSVLTQILRDSDALSLNEPNHALLSTPTQATVMQTIDHNAPKLPISVITVFERTTGYPIDQLVPYTQG